MKMINENQNENVNDNKVVQILRLSGQFLILFFFYERYFKCKKASKLTFNQIFLKAKKAPK